MSTALLVAIAGLVILSGLFKIYHITQYNKTSFIIRDLIGLALDIIFLILLFNCQGMIRNVVSLFY